MRGDIHPEQARLDMLVQWIEDSNKTPTFKVVNDDDPMDYQFPQTATLAEIEASGDEMTADEIRHLAVGQSATVGGGAAVQFTFTRIE